MRLRFWASWIVSEEDYRPLSFPPNKSILGWWCTGYDSLDRAILCGLIEANSEDAAKAAIVKDWPGVKWRFFESKPDGYTVTSDRFPLSDWMLDRQKKPVASPDGNG